MMTFLAYKKEDREFWELDGPSKFQLYLSHLTDIGQRREKLKLRQQIQQYQKEGNILRSKMFLSQDQKLRLFPTVPKPDPQLQESLES